MKKMFQRRKGFTLIELLIVIVIIGILAVGFAPTLLNAPKKARDGVRRGQIAGIQQAIEAYALDKNSTYPATGGGCIGSGGAVDTDLTPYFQGGVIPKNTAISGTLDVCPAGFGYKNDGTYYYISVLLEADTVLTNGLPTAGKSGNSAAAAATAVGGTAIADGTSYYYLVRVKY